jgi:streptomycin 6-kinase
MRGGTTVRLSDCHNFQPLTGEREFAVAPITRDFELGHSQNEVVARLNRLTAELGLDRDRACCWAIAQTVAWGFESDYPHHFETARWLLNEPG